MASTTATPRSRYFTFAQPDKEILEAFDELRNECDVVVDLIYGAAAFAILFRHWNDEAREDGRKHCQPTLSPDLSFDPNHPLAGREIMYVHSGGVEGINSQLLRYQYQGLVGIQDIQLPGKRGLKSRSTDRI
jgi:1-aminocyclopropane-1-carboxylate deaminase/D-cysteine desulfhydrase-like pyridoxal-dependent ACC family enzyme